MRHSKSKKTLLGVGSALIPATAVLISNGRYIEGGLLAIVTAGLFVGYDYLDDKVKGDIELPAGIDAELIEDVVEGVADDINEKRDGE